MTAHLAQNRPPIRFEPHFETIAAGERETEEQIAATMRRISDTTFKDYGHAVRSVHAKSHALLKGEMRVLDGLPATLAQGIFSHAATYPVIMRLSTIPGDILDDSISVPRGLAVKVIGVEGERLPGSESAVTQDFLFVDGPVFAAPNPKGFLKNLKLLAATTDRASSLKKVLSAVMQKVEATLEAFGKQSGLVKTLGGHPMTQPLGDIFYSQAPLLYGDYIAKISIAPVSPELAALKSRKIKIGGRPNALREEIREFFAAKGGEWEVRAQLCTDLGTMPIEDATVLWREDASPFMPVARITVPPQESWTESRSDAIDDRLAFSPWQGVAAHRPLGSVMRARKLAYEMGKRFRAEHNGKTITEPRSGGEVA